MVPPFIPMVTTFFRAILKIFITLQIALKPSKSFSFIKRIILNWYKHVSKKIFPNGLPFGRMVTP